MPPARPPSRVDLLAENLALKATLVDVRRDLCRERRVGYYQHLQLNPESTTTPPYCCCDQGPHPVMVDVEIERP